ncbi:hypothetical protein GCM10027614_07170 [Micromonospora vulcania]
MLTDVREARRHGYHPPPPPGRHRRGRTEPARRLDTGTGRRTRPGARRTANIIFVLTDDLAWNLVQYLPQVRQLQNEGVTFTNYTVTDSLCCPSRSSILTGKLPHNTGVFTNGGADGGFAVFKGRGNENRTFATALQGKGYRTAFLGKYLNGYLPADTQGGALPYVPPGWSEWYVAGNGYPEYNYDLNENHTVVHYGSAPADYLTNVLSRKGKDFIQRSAAAGTPFLLEVSTFAPHSPFTPPTRTSTTSRAHRPTYRCVRPVAQRPAVLAGRQRATHRPGEEHPGHQLPQACPVRAGGGPTHRQPARPAHRQRGRRQHVRGVQLGQRFPHG